jgi:hypothetical protein
MCIVTVTGPAIERSRRKETVSDLEEDLRATAEDLHEDAKELEAIEEEKLGRDPRDRRVAELSEEGERLARDIVTKASVERRLVDEANQPDQSDNGLPHSQP